MNSETSHYTGDVASQWQLKNKTLHFNNQPTLMAILNVTPDSFSDGGLYFNKQDAIDHALRLEDEGADIIDVGGESTRPYSDPVAADEELQRVVPVLEAILPRVSVPVSIDTSKSTVAKAALDLGVEIVNDVTGLTGDPDMMQVVVGSKAGICAMHMQGTPQTMQDNPSYDHVVEDILQYLRDRDSALIESGVEPNRICLDPGIGFGKTHEDNLTLLKNAHRFHETNRPILIGHSRKGFIAKLIGDKNADRTHGSVGVSLAMALQRIQILRIHDVAATKQALELFIASGAI